MTIILEGKIEIDDPNWDRPEAIAAFHAWIASHMIATRYRFGRGSAGWKVLDEARRRRIRDNTAIDMARIGAIYIGIALEVFGQFDD